MKPLPPKRALQFLQWFCREDYLEEIEGDLTEVFQKRYAHSPTDAKWKFRWSVIKYFRPEFIKSFRSSHQPNSITMFKNYLIVALRVFNREKLYSLINVSGLALGFLCCLMIYLFIKDELSYDKFHKDSERIYRLSAAYMRQGQWEPYSTNAWRTAELIKTNFGEVEELVRISSDGNIFVYKDKRVLENRIAWVDDNFFKVFSFPLIKGNPAEALKGTNKVVISESTAAKYFGADEPMGKVFDMGDGAVQLQVSGVMKDMPANSHFHLDMLISGETLRQVAPEGLFTNVGWDSQYVYFKATPGMDPAKMEAAFPDFINKNLDFWKSTNFKLFLQPLLSIHLQSDIGTEFETNGSLIRVYTFLAIAIFILALACINYMNLTTARSLRRAKEVGMRKTFGAKRFDLLNQFLSESFIMTLTAIVIALAFTFLLLPKFNQFAGKEIPNNGLFNLEILLTLLGAWFVIALVSGIYPSLNLSSFKPSNNMKGASHAGKSGFIFRRGLVVVQFVVSIGLIAASTIVFQQWDFMKNKDLGMNKEMLISIPLQTMDRKQLGVFKNDLFTNPLIKQAGFSNMQMPGWISNSTGYQAQDVESDEETSKSMKIMRVDYEFFKTIEVAFAEGRNFSVDYPSDSTSSIIINESAVEQLGWKDPVGKWMQLGKQKYTVVGVVKDFHFESLHRKIPPIIFIPSAQQVNWAYVRINNQNIPSALSHIEKTYSKYVTNRDFTYTFVDKDIEQQYVAEQKFTQVFSLFTILAIVIACLGTFGLISFAAERKSKEIGIRKVLGASIGSVSFLMIKEFIILLLIASAIALPLTWYFLNSWIQGFIYRTTIGVGPFVLATLLAALIVVATTGFRALKAALSNPIDSLREE
jgi:putative ABC transport system permease protein